MWTAQGEDEMKVKCVTCVEREEAKHDDSRSDDSEPTTPAGSAAARATTAAGGSITPARSGGPITTTTEGGSGFTTPGPSLPGSKFIRGDTELGGDDAGDHDGVLTINGKKYTALQSWTGPPAGKGNGPIAAGVLVKMSESPTTGTHTH